MSSNLEEYDPEIRAVGKLLKSNTVDWNESNIRIKLIISNILIILLLVVAREAIARMFPLAPETAAVTRKVIKVPGPKDAPEVDLYVYTPNPAPSTKVLYFSFNIY